MTKPIQLIENSTIIAAEGNKPKSIEEFIGRANSDTGDVSIARMKSPAGWQEPGQTPEFDEYTVVLAGTLQVETSDQVFEVGAGQAITTPGPYFSPWSWPASRPGDAIH